MGNICNRLAAFEHRCFLIVLDTPKKHGAKLGTGTVMIKQEPCLGTSLLENRQLLLGFPDILIDFSQSQGHSTKYPL